MNLYFFLLFIIFICVCSFQFKLCPFFAHHYFLSLLSIVSVCLNPLAPTQTHLRQCCPK